MKRRHKGAEGPEIFIVNAQNKHRLKKHAYVNFMMELIGESGMNGDQISIMFTDDARMRAFNRRFRMRNAATDVISFPAGGRNIEGRINIGDIVISVPRAFRQARESGWPLDREIKQLLIHGFLHLTGFDHETDLGEMRREEKRLLGLLNVDQKKIRK